MQFKNSTVQTKNIGDHFDCVTVKNTEWDHEFSDTVIDGQIFPQSFIDGIKEKDPTQMLLSKNNSFVIDTDKDSNNDDQECERIPFILNKHVEDLKEKGLSRYNTNKVMYFNPQKLNQ